MFALPRPRRGATAIDYGVISALVALLIVAAVTTVGSNLSQIYCVIANGISGTTSSCVAPSSFGSVGSSGSASTGSDSVAPTGPIGPQVSVPEIGAGFVCPSGKLPENIPFTTQFNTIETGSNQAFGLTGIIGGGSCTDSGISFTGNISLTLTQPAFPSNTGITIPGFNEFGPVTIPADTDGANTFTLFNTSKNTVGSNGLPLDWVATDNELPGASIGGVSLEDAAQSSLETSCTDQGGVPVAVTGEVSCTGIANYSDLQYAQQSFGLTFVN